MEVPRVSQVDSALDENTAEEGCESSPPSCSILLQLHGMLMYIMSRFSAPCSGQNSIADRISFQSLTLHKLVLNRFFFNKKHKITLHF